MSDDYYSQVYQNHIAKVEALCGSGGVTERQALIERALQGPQEIDCYSEDTLFGDGDDQYHEDFQTLRNSFLEGMSAIVQACSSLIRWPR